VASVKVSLMIEVDGEPPRNFPLVKRFEPTDRASGEVTLADSATFVALPVTSEVAIHQFMFFHALGAEMAVKMMGDGTAVTLNKGGFVLVFNSKDLTGTTVQQNSGDTAKASAMVAGT